jgi:hypothetical protein
MSCEIWAARYELRDTYVTLSENPKVFNSYESLKKQLYALYVLREKPSGFFQRTFISKNVATVLPWGDFQPFLFGLNA